MTRESHSKSVCILSHDRIFSHLLAGFLRGHFPIIIVHDVKTIVRCVERDEVMLLLGDSELLNDSLRAVLYTTRAAHHKLPHVILFLSSPELQSIDARYNSCIDKVLFKPAGIEEIMTAVLEMTAQG